MSPTLPDLVNTLLGMRRLDGSLPDSHEARATMKAMGILMEAAPPEDNPGRRVPLPIPQDPP